LLVRCCKDRLQATGYRLQATGYRLQATGYRLQAKRIALFGVVDIKKPRFFNLGFLLA